MNKEGQTENKKIMKNFLAYHLMYYKPYSGVFKSRNDEKIKDKCYMDECEWRFVPDVTQIGYKQIYINEEIINKGSNFFRELSNSLTNDIKVSLPFTYNDLKYIIIKDMSDFELLIQEIDKFEIENESKIIGDFKKSKSIFEIIN